MRLVQEHVHILLELTRFSNAERSIFFLMVDFQFLI